METIEQDILLDIQSRLVQASTGKRLAKYFIDLVAFYAFFLVAAVVYFIASPDAAREGGFGSDKEYLIRLFAFLLYGLFMGLVQGIFTGTKTVNEDGTDISFSTALARGFSRIVPFEPFSAFGSPSYPWHDKWNKTYVIDVRQSGLN